jgi:hypothetical protein
MAHDSVDEVIHHGGDAVNASKSVVKREFFRWLHNESSPYRSPPYQCSVAVKGGLVAGYLRDWRVAIPYGRRSMQYIAGTNGCLDV